MNFSPVTKYNASQRPVNTSVGCFHLNGDGFDTRQATAHTRPGSLASESSEGAGTAQEESGFLIRSEPSHTPRATQGFLVAMGDRSSEAHRQSPVLLSRNCRNDLASEKNRVFHPTLRFGVAPVDDLRSQDDEQCSRHRMASYSWT